MLAESKCPDINHGLYVEKITDTSVRLGMCCQSKLTGPVETIDHYDPELQEIRKNYDSCKNCWRVEDRGGYSRRHGVIDWYKDRNITDQQGIVTLDYNTQNVCNLACISCGPGWSSKWVQENQYHKFPDKTKKYKTHKNSLVNSADLTNIRKIYFNGGEPFLSNDHKNILKQVTDLSKVDVAYNTNGTQYPDDEIIDLWSQCRNVQLYFSIDAVDKAFEFVRWPADWKQVSENIIKIREQIPHLMFAITYTCGIHNLLYLDDTLDWYEKYLATNWLGDSSSFNFQLAGPMAYGGELLALKHASDELVQHAMDQFKTVKKYSFYGSLVEALKNTTPNNQWSSYLDALSLRRNTDWRRSLARLAAYE